MNKTILMGRLTKDPEVKYLQDEKQYCNGKIHAGSRQGDIERMERQKQILFLVLPLGRMLSLQKNICKKVLKILVSGRIQTGSYVNQEGNKVYATNVIVEEHYFAEGEETVRIRKERRYRSRWIYASSRRRRTSV